MKPSPLSLPTRHVLDGPIAAISCHAGRVVFAVGNQIFVGEGGSTTHATPRRLTSLPCGSMITALASSRQWVVAGAGDRLFAVPLSETERSYWDIPFSARGRVMSVRFDSAKFLAVTSSNVLLSVTEHALTQQGRDECGHQLMQCFRGPTMALVLAADCVVLRNGETHVFAGSYGGTVTVWSVDRGGKAVRARGRIEAHTSKCAALFSVKTVCVPETDRVLVATCSDDRSAAVFLSDTSAETTWTRLIRENGPVAYSTRVFDVALMALRGEEVEEEGGGVVAFYAVATEDGAVFIHSLAVPNDEAAILATSGGPTTVTTRVSRRGLHGGRGTCKVCLTGGEDGVLTVVSGGFDGAVIAVPISTHKSTTTMSGRRATVAAAAAGPKTPQVRCVCTSAEGNMTWFCVPGCVYVSSCQTSPSQTRLLSTWAEAPAEPAMTAKDLLPSALFGVSRELAFVGTEGGMLIVCGGACGAVLLSAWVSHKKCAAMKAAAVVREPSSSSSSSSSSSEEEGSHWWILSSHTGGSVLLTQVKIGTREAPLTAAMATAVVTLVDSHGLRTTAMQLCVREGVLAAVVGDKLGSVRVYELSLGGSGRAAPPLRLQPCWSQRIFRTPVHSVCLGTAPNREAEGSSLSGELWLFVSSDGGCFAEVNVRASSRPSACGSDVLVPWPLHFPFEVSRVLHYAQGVCVAQLGTSVLVHRSRPDRRIWTRVAEFANVKAPRLVHVDWCRSSGDVSLTHCSDGLHIETVSTFDEAAVKVWEGLSTGKDFNCTLAIPAFGALVHGNEDGSLCLDGRCGEGDEHAATRPTPTIVKGPHRSNILAIAELPLCDAPIRTSSSEKGEGDRTDCFRFVTVGGLSTLCVWEWSAVHQLRVLAAAELTGQQGTGGVGKRQRAAPAPTTTPTAAAATEDRIPRFMSVVAPRRDLVVVGSSDATLRVVRLTDTTTEMGEWTLCEVTLSAPPQLDTDVPKPIVSLCVAEASADGRVLLVAGDTNGRVYVVRLDEAYGDCKVTTLFHRRLEQSCVNALTSQAVHLRASHGAFLLAAMHDSGNVVLLRVSSNEGVSVLHSCSTGLTAGRGVTWCPEGAGDVVAHTGTDATAISTLGKGEARAQQCSLLVAVNDERVVVFDVVDEEGPALRVRDASRITVRCVSGLSVSPPQKKQQATLITVVGQGVETLSVDPRIPIPNFVLHSRTASRC